MVNLKSFIEAHDLDPNETARELFPGNAYPVMAMKRILQGHALLDTDQVSRLAAFAGVPVSKVFNNGWSVSTEGTPDTPKYILETEDWRAEIDRTTWMTTLFHKGSPVQTKMISSPTVKLSELVSALDMEIIKHDFR